ncbi:MAG: adenylate/guanylate cyclase domain-containing protein [Gammaproteobacteria bacterium]|nr:adenylate/guanylate cyclase domain-containing protein [Gammaproteobacteria bacterium]
MSAFVCYRNKGVNKKVPCKAVLTLGRDKNSDIVIIDLLASRNHAMIRRLGRSDYYLIDSGSSNGSFVNSHRVAIPRLLKSGDRIQIGGSELVFEQDYKEEDVMDTISMEETIISDRPVISQITVLVADIRGFTSLSESVNIRTLTRMMTKWFHNVTDVITSHGGIVDKFIGDCVFARWEFDTNQAESVIKALQAAIEINDVTEELNINSPEISEKLRIGVGINTGVASMGIGQDATAMGDAVNIAFRLETATKVLGTDIVMSESSYSSLPDECLAGEKQKIRVKGKRDVLRICSLHFSDVQKMFNSYSELLPQKEG